MRKDSTFERHGTRLTSQELVAAVHRRLARHLQAQPLLRSKSYKRFNFETSAPGLSGYYLYYTQMSDINLYAVLHYTTLCYTSSQLLARDYRYFQFRPFYPGLIEISLCKSTYFAPTISDLPQGSSRDHQHADVVCFWKLVTSDQTLGCWLSAITAQATATATSFSFSFTCLAHLSTVNFYGFFVKQLQVSYFPLRELLNFGECLGIISNVQDLRLLFGEGSMSSPASEQPRGLT